MTYITRVGFVVAAGVRQHDREFELIQRDHLPHKTMSQLICYYYNVWKLRYTAVSVGEGGDNIAHC